MSRIFNYIRTILGVSRKPSKNVNYAIPKKWKIFLDDEVLFYKNLNSNQKDRFERRVIDFLLETKILGKACEVDFKDRLLIAASSVIPTFPFKHWDYNLEAVFLMPNRFDFDLNIDGPGRNVIGLVGGGALEGRMILSKHDLHLGFKNEFDKNNVAIHEFIHLIDKADGKIDGIPEVLMDQKHIYPWLNLIDEKMEEIRNGKSDIKPYGGTSRIEFFTCTSEYFFERPDRMAKKHPRLYNALKSIFKAELANHYKKKRTKKVIPNRNDECLCGSGKKYKNCCY